MHKQRHRSNAVANLRMIMKEQRVREERQKAQSIRANSENEIMFIPATAVKGTGA